KQLDRGPSIKLTLEGLDHYSPAWSPDAKSVTYTSNVAGFFDLWTKRADGSSQPALAFSMKRDLFSPVWSPDGKWLGLNTSTGDFGLGDILAIRPGVDTTPVTL